MELSLMIGFGIIFVMGIIIGIMVDVDDFAKDFFSKMNKWQDPHREC